MSDKKEIKQKLVMIDTPLPIEDLELMNSTTFAVIGAAKDLDIELLDKVNDILKVLKSKGYKYNYANDSKDDLGNYVFTKYHLFTDIYLPFKGFNKENLVIDDEEMIPALIEPSIKAHKIAARAKFKKDKDEDGNLRYNLLNEYTKKFAARDIHLLLGGKCALKVKFMITYTSDDVESSLEKLDYNISGNATFPIRVATELGVPVFNLHKTGRIEDLKEFVNNL